MTRAATALTLTGLSKRFDGRPPVVALDGVDLTVAPGSLLAVLGPSGCGKTTMLRLVAGFERPDAGTIDLDGTVLSTPDRVVPPERRQIGIVPQEGALFPHLDVGANVAYGLPRTGRSVRRGRPRPERTRRIGELLDLVGLTGLERRWPAELSGGQQQRVALARALATDPAVVLLDEPFTALDAGLRASVRADVAATLAAAGTTAVLVTHDQTEALATAQEVAVMREGRIVQHAPAETVYRRPADLETARFVGDAVVLDGIAAGDSTVVCALGRLGATSPSGDLVSAGPVAVLLRPEQLRPEPPPSPLGAACRPEELSRPEQLSRPEEAGRLPVADGCGALVRAERYHGHDALLDLELADGTTVTARWPAVRRHRPGDAVHLWVHGPAVAYGRPG